MGGDELLGMDEVGGEEDIGGRTVLDLLGEGGRGSEGWNDVDAGGLFIGCGEGGKDGLEVGGGGDVELCCGGEGLCAGRRDCEGKKHRDAEKSHGSGEMQAAEDTGGTVS